MKFSPSCARYVCTLGERSHRYCCITPSTSTSPSLCSRFPGFQHSRSDRMLQYVDPQAIQMQIQCCWWVEQWEGGVELERGCMKLGSVKLGTITRGRASICTGAGGGEGVVVCARLLPLAGSDDGRLLARLKMSDAMPLRGWSGFKPPHVTSPRPSGN